MSYLDQLKQITAWDAEPALTEGELQGLLENAGVVDANGLAPLSEEWTPTYDLNAAASAAWLIKAARTAATVEISPPGSGIITSKVFENCRAMARIYAAKRNLSVQH